MPSKSTDRRDYENADMPMGVMPKLYPAGTIVEPHRHERGQLIYAISGLMEVSTETNLWLIPPQLGLWMPPGIEHGMRAHGAVSLRTFYVNLDRDRRALPERPQVVGISPFLRELILRAAEIPIDYDAAGHDARILALILEEVDWNRSGIGPDLKTARDRRLARLCDLILQDPGNVADLEELAALCGASSRTMARLFKGEFGVSFTYWRQLIRVFAAMPRLAAGESVTSVAMDLGYETPGAFTQVFRKFFGVPPSKYFP